MNIIESRTKARLLVPHTLQAQLATKLQDRRKEDSPVPTERRGRNLQRNGYEEWKDIDTAFTADEI